VVGKEQRSLAEILSQILHFQNVTRFLLNGVRAFLPNGGKYFSESADDIVSVVWVID
jgi:hypothetical protein